MKDEPIHLELGAISQPRIIFKPRSWLAKIDFINHLVLFNNTLITVLCEKDGGKTSFSTLLDNNLDKQIKSLAMKLTVPCDRQAMIQEIAVQLNLNNSSQTDLQSIASQLNERRAPVLLIIDDAHNAPESLLKELLDVVSAQEDGGFFHVCLISDYSIVASLNRLAADNYPNLVHTIELGALTESETRTYTLQRAMTARLINRPLSEAQYKQFFQLTKGNVAKINASLEAFILKNSKQKKSNRTWTGKNTGIAALGALAAIGLAYFSYDILSLSRFTAPVAVVEAEQPLVSRIASWQENAVHQFVYNELPKQQVLDEVVEEELLSHTVALVDKVVVIPKIKPKAQAITQAAQAAANKQLASRAVATAKRSLPVPNKQIAKARVPDNTAKKKADESSLFTIQLIASHDREDIDHFRATHRLAVSTKIRHFTNESGKWYVLTLGEYEDRSSAQTQIQKLKAEIARLNPWVRPVSGLSALG